MNLFMIFIASGGVTGLIFIFYYNRLARSKVAVQEAYSGIKVQLEKRYEVIPKLESLMREDSDHELNLIKSLGKWKSKSENSSGAPGRASAEQQFSNALQQIFSSENNSDQFRELRISIEKTEKEIEMAVRYYNALVREFNTKCEVVPTALVAALLRFRKMEYFEKDLQA